MEAKRINVVLVGCGAVSQNLYTPALKFLNGQGETDVVALVDPSERERTKMHSEFPGAAVYSDFGSYRVKPGELVIIASPPRFHADQAIRALSGGAAVLCEKPMATDAEECQRMIDAANRFRSVLAVGLFRRFFPAAEALREIVDRKTFGKLLEFEIAEGGKLGWGAASDYMFKPGITTGGVLADLGTHVLDFLISIVGEPNSFSYQDDAMGGVEANCFLNLEYDSGVRGTVNLSYDWATANVHVYKFEKVTIVYRVGGANRLTFHFEGLPFALESDISKIVGDLRYVRPILGRNNPQSFTQQILNVINAMRGMEEVRISGEEGMRSIKLIEKCYGQRKLLDMDWLSEREMVVAREYANII